MLIDMLITFEKRWSKGLSEALNVKIWKWVAVAWLKINYYYSKLVDTHSNYTFGKIPIFFSFISVCIDLWTHNIF